MKKYLIIIFAFLALSGYSQQDLKARYMNVTRMLYSGTDSLISPADSAHQFNYMKMKDPVLSLDGVNKRSMERFVGDTAKLLHWADTLHTSGARIATGDDIKNMIDGSGTANFVPKFSDANTLTNSVFKDDGTIATLEQNSVQPFTSVASGAVDNTLYLKAGKTGINTTAPDNPLTVNCGTTGGFELDYNDANGSAVNKVVYGVTSSGDATVTPSGGDVELTTSNLKLQNTTNASQFGVIYKGTTPFIHNFNYGNNGTVTTEGYNFFAGGAGNLTMGATATQTYHSSYNTFSGAYAGYSNTTGSNNTFSGVRAGFSNTTGSSNTFSGFYAGYSNTTGYANTFSGAYAGNSNTTGYYNTFLGYQSGYFNTTGSNNTFSGFRAGYSNTTGSSNTFSGNQSGIYIADGTTALTVVNNSLFLGANTKAKADNSTNEIVIGYNVTGNGSNTVTIGNSSITNNYFNGNLISGKIKTTQITAALTDNTPTDAEIDAATSLTPSTAGAGWQCTIKDNNGSGLLYKIESDGTDWYYIVLTKAL